MYSLLSCPGYSSPNTTSTTPKKHTHSSQSGFSKSSSQILSIPSLIHLATALDLIGIDCADFYSVFAPRFPSVFFSLPVAPGTGDLRPLLISSKTLPFSSIVVFERIIAGGPSIPSRRLWFSPCRGRLDGIYPLPSLLPLSRRVPLTPTPTPTHPDLHLHITYIQRTSN